MRLRYTLTLLFFVFIQPSFGQLSIYSKHMPMDSLVNSPSDEQHIVLSQDGNQMFFVRKNHPLNTGGAADGGDIWWSEVTDSGRWSPAINLSAVNTPETQLLLGLIDNDRKIVIYQNNAFYYCLKQGNTWTKPNPFDVPYFKSKSKELSGSMAGNGKYLLFGMESFGSYGVEDIYVSRRSTDNKWTNPRNLGRTINTPFQEISPFLAADNKTLFFASNGLGGEGSFDIFMTTRLDDTWQKWSNPINLGSKVNTPGRETSLAFLPDGTYAYLSSTQNSDGYGDIKKVKIMPEIVPVAEQPAPKLLTDSAAVEIADKQDNLITITGSVIDKKSEKAVIGAEVFVVTDPSNQEYQTLTNSTGNFNISVVEGNSYEIKIRAFRYLSIEELVDQAEIEFRLPLDYRMEPIIDGNTVTLDHVLFEQGKSIMIEGSQKELDLVVEMMKYNPDISIFLAGHTDNQGKASLNVKLSQDRVQAVTDYLISKGVNKKRLDGKGFGGTKPIASNASAETRRLNRRVEFTVRRKQKSTDQ